MVTGASVEGDAVWAKTVALENVPSASSAKEDFFMVIPLTNE